MKAKIKILLADNVSYENAETFSLCIEGAAPQEAKTEADQRHLFRNIAGLLAEEVYQYNKKKSPGKHVVYTSLH